jgi:hypothetical protein
MRQSFVFVRKMWVEAVVGITAETVYSRHSSGCSFRFYSSLLVLDSPLKTLDLSVEAFTAFLCQATLTLFTEFTKVLLETIKDLTRSQLGPVRNLFMSAGITDARRNGCGHCCASRM